MQQETNLSPTDSPKICLISHSSVSFLPKAALQLAFLCSFLLRHQNAKWEYLIIENFRLLDMNIRSEMRKRELTLHIINILSITSQNLTNAHDISPSRLVVWFQMFLVRID